MKEAVKFESILKDHLADAAPAAKYLTACYVEGPEIFLQGLRDVVEAQGGMARAARLAKLNRESMNRQLSRRGNTSLTSLHAVLNALGLKAWQRRGLHAALERVKRRVSPKQFQMFDLYVTQEWPMEPVTSTLGVNAAQVYMAKMRIGRALRNEIKAFSLRGG